MIDGYPNEFLYDEAVPGTLVYIISNLHEQGLNQEFLFGEALGP